MNNTPMRVTSGKNAAVESAFLFIDFYSLLCPEPIYLASGDVCRPQHKNVQLSKTETEYRTDYFPLFFFPVADQYPGFADVFIPSLH